MALNGNLSTMPATDLLQWIAQAGKTGTLRVEREQVCRRIQFMNGRVSGCSSNDSSFRLGQVLLSRGLIKEEHLRQALERQQASGESIGRILISIGAIDEDDLERMLKAKAEETIFGCFDWDDAVFRFSDSLEADPYLVEVNLEVQDVVLRGLQRFDEMKRFRGVFSDGSVVLDRTGKSVPPEVTESRMARRIFDSIDGERSLAEIVLHARSSEYLVTKFLFQLERMGIVEVLEKEPPATEAPAGQDEREIEVYDLDADATENIEVDHGQLEAEVEVEDETPPERRNLSAEVAVADGLLDRGEPEAALELLTAVHRAHPGELYLREKISRAEQAVEMAHRETFAPHKIPVLTCAPEKIRELGLSAEASFLPSLIDGDTDVRSILWLAPMSTVDVLRTLKQMLDRGLIKLTEGKQQAVAG